MRFRSMVLGVVLAAISGCGEAPKVVLTAISGGGAEPRLDTSSRAALDASIEAMCRGMSAAERKEFGMDCGAAATRVTQGGTIPTYLLSGSFDPELVLRPLDKKTMSEIRSLAAEYRTKGPWGN